LKVNQDSGSFKIQPYPKEIIEIAILAYAEGDLFWLPKSQYAEKREFAI
jgi:hypothetical protein